jgi:hypothetical protein
MNLDVRKGQIGMKILKETNPNKAIRNRPIPTTIL